MSETTVYLNVVSVAHWPSAIIICVIGPGNAPLADRFRSFAHQNATDVNSVLSVLLLIQRGR
jgi:hypothetical protein